MDFEWDPAKSDSNIKKHGIDFQDAARVFADPRATTENVSRPEFGETRSKTVGMVDDELMAVIYTDRGAARRIISARRTRKNERRDYDEGQTP